MIICNGAVQFVLFMHVNVHANGQYCSLTKYWITRNVKKKCTQISLRTCLPIKNGVVFIKVITDFELAYCKNYWQTGLNNLQKQMLNQEIFKICYENTGIWHPSNLNVRVNISETVKKCSRSDLKLKKICYLGKEKIY